MEIYFNDYTVCYVLFPETKKGHLAVLFERDGKWFGLVRFPTNEFILCERMNILCEGLDGFIEAAKKRMAEGPPVKKPNFSIGRFFRRHN